MNKRRPKKRERDKNKESKEQQDGRKKEKNKREIEKEKVKKGEARKAKEKERETLKNNQKCPFLGGKRGFFYQSKEKKDKKTSKNKQNEIRKKQKHRNTPPPKSFSIISKNCLFLVGVQNFPFLTTWSKKRTPKKTIAIRVSATHFLKNGYASRNGHFWTKKPKTRNSSYHFLFFSSFNNKTQKHLKPLFL